MLPLGCPSEKTLRENLFDQQVETLLARGYHGAMKKTEDDFRDWLSPFRQRLTGIDEIDPKHIPFLIVVPHRALSVAEQMYLLVLEKKRGAVGLDAEWLRNVDRLGSLDGPYLVYGVEDGTATLGQSSDEAGKEIRRRQDRHGLTTEEGIALVTHSPEVLRHHAVFLVDADYRGYNPELWLSSGGPVLGYDWKCSKRADRGVPSCAFRVVP